MTIDRDKKWALQAAHAPETRHLPIARYRFIAQMQEDVWLPEYAGSLFRGQFGAALRRLSCMTGQPVCHGCPLLTTCPYTQIFKPVPPAQHDLQSFSAIPAGYIIVPPMPQKGYREKRVGRQFVAAGEVFSFEMVLVGHIRKQLPLIIYAWQRALTRGLTKGRKNATLLAVQCLNSIHNHRIEPARQELRAVHNYMLDQWPEYIWTQDTQDVQAHDNEITVPKSSGVTAGSLKLVINTPLRLQRRGRIVGPRDMDIRTLISGLARRIALIMEFHSNDPRWGERVPHLIALAEYVQNHDTLRWFDWRRYSSRQRQEMALGGVVGSVELRAEPMLIQILWPWFWLGQWLHVGKNATFGMGHYQLQYLHNRHKK